jgi:hypothetical protein
MFAGIGAATVTVAAAAVGSWREGFRRGVHSRPEIGARAAGGELSAAATAAPPPPPTPARASAAWTVEAALGPARPRLGGLSLGTRCALGRALGRDRVWCFAAWLCVARLLGRPFACSVGTTLLVPPVAAAILARCLVTRFIASPALAPALVARAIAPTSAIAPLAAAMVAAARWLAAAATVAVVRCLGGRCLRASLAT